MKEKKKFSYYNACKYYELFKIFFKPKSKTNLSNELMEDHIKININEEH